MQKTSHKKERLSVDLDLIAFAFALSGCAGLIYQVAWQRILFSSVGIDLASVAIIVSAFMLGLGCGALLGGFVSDWLPRRALHLFCLCEFGVGIYGWFSANLLRAVSDAAVLSSLLSIAIANFLIILFPTVLMGATLPILISHIFRVWRDIAKATGYLYAVNTFGAMLGAFLTGFVLFNFLELSIVIKIAAGINIGVGVLVYIKLRGSR